MEYIQHTSSVIIQDGTTNGKQVTSVFERSSNGDDYCYVDSKGAETCVIKDPDAYLIANKEG